MRARSDARGYVELRGPTWFLKRHVVAVDGETGELVRRRVRTKLGPKTELRTRAAARAAADRWLASTRPDVLMPGRQVLAVDYLEHFLATHVPPMRKTSQLKYRSVIRTHLEHELAHLKLGDIDTAATRELIVSLSTRREDPLARATIATIRAILLQVLRQAIRDGYGACKIDPRDVKLPAAGVEREPAYFDAAAIERILAAAELPWRALYALMAFAGLRIGEALGITWGQVELEARLLKVRQAATNGELAPLKTKTSRGDVPIVDELATILAAFRERTPDTGPADLLFRTRRGRPYAADDVRRRQLQPLLTTLGLPRVGCHAFRHGLPRRLSAAGVTPAMIQRIMRHSTLAMTERYLHTHNADTVRSLAAAGLMQRGGTNANQD